MADSLRARLLVWFAAIVMLVIAMVGAAVCWMTWRSRLSAIDAELVRRGESIARAVRPGPEGRVDVELPADVIAYFQRPDAAGVLRRVARRRLNRRSIRSRHRARRPAAAWRFDAREQS